MRLKCYVGAFCPVIHRLVHNIEVTKISYLFYNFFYRDYESLTFLKFMNYEDFDR